jgi:spore coat protein U-like protein
MMAAALACLGVTPTLAQAVSPVRMDVVLTVQDGCSINGGEQTPEALLSFGTATNIQGIPGDIDGSTTGIDGGSSFRVICNVPIGQVLAAVSGGENDLDGVRRLANMTTPGQFVPYHIYLDEGRTVEFGIDAPLPLFDLGREENNRVSPLFFFDLYGRIFSPIDVVAGSYADAATIRLTF